MRRWRRGPSRSLRSVGIGSAPLVAYVMTRDVVSGSCPEIARTVRARFGADARVAIDLSEEDGPRGFLEVDGIEISVISLHGPIPAGDELRALARSPKDPEGSLADHMEHVVVSTVRRKHVGHEASLRAALAVLKVCFALCETERVSAVMWYLSRALLDRETFMVVLSPEALEEWPVPIWALVRFQPFEVAEGEDTRLAGIAGLGFRRFIGRDIEFEPNAVPLQGQYTRLLTLGVDLLQRGLYIKEGESWGWSADDVFRARYLEQGRVVLGPVVSFTVEKFDQTA